MIKKIISGGETGADRAGLDAALSQGIKTGGTMPFAYKALDGFHPDFKTKYDIEMHDSSSYVPRTKKNARDSDGTIRFAMDFESPGEKCTLKAINSYKKPYIDVDFHDPISVEDVIKWIEDNEIEVLNVAGNSESTSPGIYEFTFNFLSDLLSKGKQMKKSEQIRIEYDDDALSITDKIADALLTFGVKMIDDGECHDGFMIFNFEECESRSEE